MLRRPCRASRNPHAGQAPSHIFVLLCSSITKQPGGKITTSYSVTANLLTSCTVPAADSSTSKALQEVSVQVVCLFFRTQDLVVIAAIAGSITALTTLLTNWLQEERWGCVRAAAELGRSQLLTPEPHCHASDVSSKRCPAVFFASSLSILVNMVLWLGVLSFLGAKKKKLFFTPAVQETHSNNRSGWQ